MHFAVAPGRAEFIRRHGHGRECRGWLAMEEAEALRQFVRDQVAQRDVVDQQDQPDVFGCIRRRDAHRHVAGDNRDFAFEIDAVGFIGDDDVVARADEAVGTALIHQRVSPEARRHLDAARFAYQFNMVHVGRAVSPLVSARQRRHALCRIKRLRLVRHRNAKVVGLVEPRCNVGQFRRGVRPVVECGLQGADARSLSGADTNVEVLRDDDQRTVSAAVFQCRKFHDRPQLERRWLS